MMITTEDLKELRIRNIKKRALERRIADLRLTAKSSTSNLLSSRITGPRDKVGNIVADIVDLQAEYEHQVADIIRLTKKINKILAKMDNERYQTILIEYYINGVTIESIAEELDLSPRRVIDLKKYALKSFEKISSRLHCISH